MAPGKILSLDTSALRAALSPGWEDLVRCCIRRFHRPRPPDHASYAKRHHQDGEANVLLRTSYIHPQSTLHPPFSPLHPPYIHPSPPYIHPTSLFHQTYIHPTHPYIHPTPPYIHPTSILHPPYF